MAIVAMDASDVLLQPAYREWSNAGVCPLAFENLRNGRFVTMDITWPKDFEGQPEGDTDMADRLNWPSVLYDLVDAMAKRENVRLNCAEGKARHFSLCVDN